MVSDATRRDFSFLFQGRTDRYGTEEGGSIEADPGVDYWATHLEGDHPLGVYPQVDLGLVAWGCVDFDEGEDDSLIYAMNTRLVLGVYGIAGWVERSRSKGYHVWVFCEEWVPAIAMREALLAACQIAGSPTKEINPKQIITPEKPSIGNYVRLPYPNGYTNRRVVVDVSGEDMTLEQFMACVMNELASEDELLELAKLYVPPAKPVIRDVGPIDQSKPWIKRLDGLAYTILTQGPKEGGDRSDALWTMANAMARSGTVSYEEALEALHQADQSWGKYTERGDAEQRLSELMDKVWAK